MKNKMKEKLGRGEVVIGSFMYIPSSKLTEIVGWLGFDFVVIDQEHGPVDTSQAEDMVRAAEHAGATPIIRVSHNTPHLILRAFDIGAHAIHVPEINTKEEAELAAKSARYGPVGQRGLGGVRAAKYGLAGPLSEYAPQANEENLVIAHIEHYRAVDNLDELLAVDGIYIYYLGPEDLSNSLGIPGQSKDPRVVELVESSIQRIAAAGKVAGCIAADPATARRYCELGALYIASHAIKFMSQASREFLKEVRA
ncbi:MAG: aldolase/citrate lyase family protein [Planctomycetes bacterium]|nr:aldolase/citrate lyase family protein [Planctomycetota bacterium]